MLYVLSILFPCSIYTLHPFMFYLYAVSLLLIHALCFISAVSLLLIHALCFIYTVSLLYIYIASLLYVLSIAYKALYIRFPCS